MKKKTKADDGPDAVANATPASAKKDRPPTKKRKVDKAVNAPSVNSADEAVLGKTRVTEEPGSERLTAKLAPSEIVDNDTTDPRTQRKEKRKQKEPSDVRKTKRNPHIVKA